MVMILIRVSNLLSALIFLQPAPTAYQLIALMGVACVIVT